MHLLVRLACRDLQRGAARSIKLRRSHDSVTSVHPKRELDGLFLEHLGRASVLLTQYAERSVWDQGIFTTGYTLSGKKGR
jgi:hypothetical protein